MKTYFYPSAKNSMQFDIKQWQSIFFILIFICLDRPIILQAGITSNLLCHEADSIAATIDNNLQIIQIRSNDVDSSGKSDIWNYKYINYKKWTYVNVHLGMDSVFVDTSQRQISGLSQMALGWIDSDSALAIAEANGGGQFRKKYEDVQIIADLSNYSAGPAKYTEWNITYCSKKYELVKFSIAIFSISGSIDYSWETSVNSHENEYSYYLSQNYPNPFNSLTTIAFGIDKPGFTTLKIYDINGRMVDIPIESFYELGDHKINWDPRTLPSGIYFCRLQSGKTYFTKKLVYLR
jgi:hypothetical protein